MTTNRAGDAIEKLSEPERRCARIRAKLIGEMIREDGGCCYCANRMRIFENVGRRALCGLDPSKQFPICVGIDGGFNFDERAFAEGAGRCLQQG